MKVNYDEKKKELLMEFTEEIDHHTTEKIRRRADYEIQRHIPRKVIFDFYSVTFMDSAGIGMVIGRYKLIHLLGGTLEIANVNKNVKRILEMAGIGKILSIKEQEENTEQCS